MKYIDIEIGQIVCIEKKGHQYDGFYGKVVFKGDPENEGGYFVKVALLLKEMGDDVISMEIEFRYNELNDLADSDGFWEAAECQHGCPTIIDQFNWHEDAFEEGGGNILKEEIADVFERGDFCRALRYLLDIETFVGTMYRRIKAENEGGSNVN